jgi:hypothetical protein
MVDLATAGRIGRIARISSGMCCRWHVELRGKEGLACERRFPVAGLAHLQANCVGGRGGAGGDIQLAEYNAAVSPRYAWVRSVSESRIASSVSGQTSFAPSHTVPIRACTNPCTNPCTNVLYGHTAYQRLRSVLACATFGLVEFPRGADPPEDHRVECRCSRPESLEDQRHRQGAWSLVELGINRNRIKGPQRPKLKVRRGHQDANKHQMAVRTQRFERKRNRASAPCGPITSGPSGPETSLRRQECMGNRFDSDNSLLRGPKRPIGEETRRGPACGPLFCVS